MDQKQKDLLNSAAPQLADIIDFVELAGQLQLAKIITKRTIDEITASVESRFSRNLKLIYALQDSACPTTFDDFIQILEVNNHTEALRLLIPNRSNKKTPKSGGSGGIFSKLMSLRFGDSQQGSKPYPLGMNSGQLSSLDDSAQDVDLGRRDRGQVNNFVIKSKGQSTSCEEDRRLGLNVLSKKLPAFPREPTNSPMNNSQPIMSQQSFDNLLPQTTNRQYELRIQNLSINDQVRHQREAQNVDEDPVVCWHPYAKPQSNNPDALRASSPHYCNPSYASSYDSDSSSDSINIDSTLILDSDVTMAIAKDEANTMSVKLTTVCHNDVDDYKMTSRPRGICLIINNIDFNEEIFPTRTGSDVDAKRFDEIFTQLYFSVVLKRNQTADQMKETFQEVASKCKPEHDALFIFILSHGSEHGIYGVDGIEVYLESDIISCFDNRNCKAMLGKPKVFVLQACRGRAKDCGGDGGDMLDSIACSPVTSSPIVRTASQGNRVPDSWLPSLPKEKKKQKHPIRTDMLLVFSCLAGFVSVRNELRGSWLGVALSYFIMTHAHEKDLVRILNLVTSDIIQRESSHGHIQSIEVKLLGWTKNLYLNPGI